VSEKTPGQAAASAEIERLKGELAAKEAELEELQGKLAMTPHVPEPYSDGRCELCGYAPDNWRHDDAPVELAKVTTELAAVLADRNEVSNLNAWQGSQLAAIREKLTALAADLNESALATQPSKKSDIEFRTARAVLAITGTETT
jgi:hypothetical protein